MTDLFDDFRDLLVELHDAKAEFVIVGGYAVTFHGHVRATKDLDVLVRPDTNNAARVVRALDRFGAPLAQLGVGQEDFETPGTVVQLGVPPIRIDLITEASGISFDEALDGHETLIVEGRRIPVIARAPLLKNKRASGRMQDLADVEALTSLDPRAR